MSRLKHTIIYHAIRFFRLKGSPEQVARGFAIGIFPNFLPTFGFGVVFSGFLARLFGGNLAAGLVGGASLAFVWPLLFYFNMQVGGLFESAPVVIDDVEDVSEEKIGALMWGKTFLIGAAINGLATCFVAYLGMLSLYQKVQPSALSWLRRLAQARTRSKQLKKLRRQGIAQV